MLKKINFDQNSWCFRWVGNGECFLFSIQPKMAIFHSTGKVNQHQIFKIAQHIIFLTDPRLPAFYVIF